MRRDIHILSLAVLSYLTFSAPAKAELDGGGEEYIKFSGFGTLGAVHNQADGATFIRDITVPNGAKNRGLSWEVDSRFGLQANFKPTESLEGVAQVVSHYRWDNTFRPELTWGFLKYTPNESVDLRFGRIGFEAFLAADTRDVGYSYLWVRPPVEYYGAIPIPYVDGMDIVLRTPIGNGVGRLKAYSGIARQIVPTQGMLEDLSESRVTGGFLDYQDTHWTVRLGIADMRLGKEIPMGAFDVLGYLRGMASIQPDPSVASSVNALAKDISLIDKHVTFTSIALAYEDGPFQTQMAMSKFTPQSLVFPVSHSGYLSVGYRQGKITPYAVISAVRSKRVHRADELMGKGVGLGPALDIANYIFSGGQQNQNTYSLGMRYDFMSKVALKL